MLDLSHWYGYQLIGLLFRLFATGPEDQSSVTGQVRSGHTKDFKNST